MAAPDTETDTDVDALIDRYVREAQAEAVANEAVVAAETTRLRAAFEAGAPLLTLIPVELWDPVERRTVRVGGGTVLRVAEHEGDILLDRLTDNSHSLGVVYEEAHRWTPHKYFLPLATLCHPARIRTDDLAAERARQVDASTPAATAPGVRGLELGGQDADTAAAVAQLEQLAERDDRAVLPRGTQITLPRGGEARDPETGEAVALPPGTRCEVTEAVGDFRDPNDPVSPPIPVRVGERPLHLSFDLLMGLDMQRDVLSPRAQELKDQADLARRRSLQRMIGLGLGAALLAWDGFSWTRTRRNDPDEANRDLFAWLVPQFGLLYAYFSAGGKYWFDLRGALMDLNAESCLDSTRQLESALRAVSQVSGETWAIYEKQFHRSVHTSWNETRHYRTDKDGKRHYTHSTWSKGYTTMWCEPSGVRGCHAEVGRWQGGDAHRTERARRLLDERIFNLLASKADAAEKDFHLAKQSVSFTRDATLSALTAAICLLPPAFYDELANGFLGPGSITPEQGLVPYQQNALSGAAVVAGLILAERHRKKLDAQLRQNKYDLGRQLEDQIRRVPGLSFHEAWPEFMSDPPASDLPESIAARRPRSDHIARNAASFTYIHGNGYDHGRPLDPCFIDAGPVRDAFTRATPRWEPLSRAVAAVVDDREHQARLVRVLRNAVGTEILDAQMKADQSEAKTGALTQSLWFAAPMWGTAILDAAIKITRS